MDPERLTASDLIPNTPFRIYHTTLKESYPLHWHDFYELAIVLRGTGIHTVNGRNHSIKPNTLFLLTPVDFHQLTPSPLRDLEIYNIIFGGEFLDNELRQWLFTGFDYRHFNPSTRVSRRILSLFENVWEESNGNALGRDRLMRSSLEQILLEVARHSQASPQTNQAGHSAIHNALMFLHHHFRSPLSLEFVAMQVGLSPNYFSRTFHKTTGVQFQKYLQTLRLRFAASLLLASDLPITEICFASGFGNMAHFGRAFRDQYHVSSSDYRSKRITS